MPGVRQILRRFVCVYLYGTREKSGNKEFRLLLMFVHFKLCLLRRLRTPLINKGPLSKLLDPVVFLHLMPGVHQTIKGTPSTLSTS